MLLYKKQTNKKQSHTQVNQKNVPNLNVLNCLQNTALQKNRETKKKSVQKVIWNKSQNATAASDQLIGKFQLFSQSKSFPSHPKAVRVTPNSKRSSSPTFMSLCSVKSIVICGPSGVLSEYAWGFTFGFFREWFMIRPYVSMCGWQVQGDAVASMQIPLPPSALKKKRYRRIGSQVVRARVRACLPACLPACVRACLPV